MSIFGLIGKTLSHSFSEGYFNDKFHKEDINDAEYKNFELNNISEFTDLISKIKLSGLNVTTPYKESIIPFLDELTPHANAIGAVNTIQFKDNKLIGHNTDTIGFLQSIYPLLNKRNKALILGNGGASKAIQYVLKKLNIEYKIVSRKSSFDYLDISSESIGYYDIIINTTPLGTHPKIADFPQIPYKELNENHLLFDVIYNPTESAFLRFGKTKNCSIKNGLEMLEIQAESSWNIWNS
ncbi:shikimate dehydrogenase [Flavobacteriales bacterium]|jgi:shikimate dehydrogenase|nr:shikimate dehydrogenase [Flavobacteriales bacterium]